MKHKQDAIDKAMKVVKLHSDNGLSFYDSVKSAIITIQYALDTGLYPGYLSVNKRAVNYLKSIPVINLVDHHILEK